MLMDEKAGSHHATLEYYIGVRVLAGIGVLAVHHSTSPATHANSQQKPDPDVPRPHTPASYRVDRPAAPH